MGAVSNGRWQSEIHLDRLRPHLIAYSWAKIDVRSSIDEKSTDHKERVNT